MTKATHDEIKTYMQTLSKKADAVLRNKDSGKEDIHEALHSIKTSLDRIMEKDFDSYILAVEFL